MAYIRFATEEKELFKLLFMRDRSAENINDDSGKDVTEAMVRPSKVLEPDEQKNGGATDPGVCYAAHSQP